MSAVKAHFSRNQQLRLHVCRIEMETFMPRSTVLPVKSSSVKPRNTLSYCQIGNLGARNKSRQPGDHRMQRFVLLFTAALLSLTFATNKPAEAAAVSGPESFLLCKQQARPPTWFKKATAGTAACAAVTFQVSATVLCTAIPVRAAAAVAAITAIAPAAAAGAMAGVTAAACAAPAATDTRLERTLARQNCRLRTALAIRRRSSDRVRELLLRCSRAGTGSDH